jgi:hypothetical protein
MSDNDIPRWDLELVRSKSTAVDVPTPTQPEVIYTSLQPGEISNQMVIIVLALIIGIVAIVYSRNCNCTKN